MRRWRADYWLTLCPDRKDDRTKIEAKHDVGGPR